MAWRAPPVTTSTPAADGAHTSKDRVLTTLGSPVDLPGDEQRHGQVLEEALGVQEGTHVRAPGQHVPPPLLDDVDPGPVPAAAASQPGRQPGGERDRLAAGEPDDVLGGGPEGGDRLVPRARPEPVGAGPAPPPRRGPAGSRVASATASPRATPTTGSAAGPRAATGSCREPGPTHSGWARRSRSVREVTSSFSSSSSFGDRPVSSRWRRSRRRP